MALDCSKRTLVYAKRKLQSLLSDTEFSRLRFVCGDIMDLSPDCQIAKGGFDLVVCCGVLHHLKDPSAGLCKLASVLTENGVLQLATYSTLSVQTWQPDIQRWLRSSASCRHLFNGPDSAPIRTPTKEEVQSFRAEVP